MTWRIEFNLKSDYDYMNAPIIKNQVVIPRVGDCIILPGYDNREFEVATVCLDYTSYTVYVWLTYGKRNKV